MDNSKSAPKFIFFDAGFTLLEPNPSVGFHYAELAREYGVDVPADVLDRAFFVAWKAVRKTQPATLKVPYGITDDESRGFWTQVVRECFAAAGGGVPQPPEYYARLYDRFAEARCWRLYPDVPEALGVLRKAGIPWGILSNWDARLRSVVAGFPDLADCKLLVISSEAGAEKPDPEIFRVAEAKCGFAGNDVVLFGDDAEADGVGAERVGWRGVGVARGAGAGEAPLAAAVCGLIAQGRTP